MYRIVLINMPFANLRTPSIALTQLQSRVLSACGCDVSVEILDLNQNFAKYLGLDLYEYVTDSFESQNAGLGDWFFRHIAFPDSADNADKYFERYFPFRTPEAIKLKERILQSRAGTEKILNDLISSYRLDQAEIVGFTSMFMQSAASFAMAARLKQCNPSVVTVIGGANCEFPMGQVMSKRVKQIDYVFSGPALKSFPEFVQYCMKGEASNCKSLRGVFPDSSELPKTGQQTIGEDLPLDVPIDIDYGPFLRTLEESFPNGEVEPVLPFETSRGCWWGAKSHCTFCGLNGANMGYRAMSPERAIKQFNSLFQYSAKVSLIEAVDNILPKSYLSDVLPFLNTPPNVSIFYEVKADLNEKEVEVLARAGVRRIQPGIEALATSTLKLMRKGTTAFQNLSLLKMLALYDIHPAWNLLVGFPGEEEKVYERYNEVLPLFYHLCPPYGVFPVRFDRFSPYFNEAQKYDLNLRPLSYYALIYPFDQADLNDLAYYFADENISAPYFTGMAKWIRKLRAKVSDWQAAWENPKGGPAPRLVFNPNSTIVYDSRLGKVVEHQVGQIGKAILDFLSQPGRIDTISKALSHIEGLNVEKEVEILEQKGLLFREGDRLLSLVLDGAHGSRKPAQERQSRLTMPADVSPRAAELVVIQTR